LIVLALVAALGIALYLRAKAPPEAARLLPESDAILYVHLNDVRAFTHFDQTPVARSPALQQFIDATGIVPERDIDSAAFALHRVTTPAASPGRHAKFPAFELFVSEVFVGRFDGQRLGKYLKSIAASTETYDGRPVYSIPVGTGDPGGQTLRVAQLAYDTIVASDMPTAEQIHSMLDRSRASALGTPGSSLLAARYRDVPLLSEAWGIGHIGLPFAEDGRISVMGLELPLPEDTDFVASLRYIGTVHLGANGAVHLRIEEIASDESAAHATVETLTTLLGVLRGIGSAQPPGDSAQSALRAVLDSVKLEQRRGDALLTASATVEQLKALAAAHNPAAEGSSPAAGGADPGELSPLLRPRETSPAVPASK
jgi:hypothetical protein